MKFLLWSTLMLTVIQVFGQDLPPILAAAKPQKGIYKDFQEFLNNAPSIQSPFMILCKSGDDKIERGTADYRVMLLDTATKKRDLKKFWGVYDGDAVYINEIIYGGHLNFKRVHGIGRYCYFKGSLVNNGSKVGGAALAAGLVGGAIAAAVIEIDGDHPYVLNINNGIIYQLDKETFRTILQKDQELLASYEEDERRQKRSTMLSYIAKYNDRHRDEIKYNRPIDVAFYRREKKGRTDPIELNVGDTIQLSLEPNSLKQVKWYKDSLDICIGSTCRTITLQRNVVNYVECSWRSGQQEFKKVDKKVGEFYEREIRAVNERKR